ncbi:hypothetical protein BN14_05896 [Rhizoctonia solani AG-1 IB]|uniref:F-box domain-containing protein n=1 Tax=Thanatephorus cucumeris (strain AG1-IB / isolate 7/3/14) TaxID=1108050 RepID=M5BXF0_THACB|nr:hypothetical protein BN14_05896 [Rhizoctonia solani AG-1 IB]
MDSDIEITEPIQTQGSESTELALPILESVRSLSLSGVIFPWDSPVYHNLLQLHIGGIPYDISPHIHHILDVLSACPLLQELKISKMAILQCDQVPIKPVYLMQLERLELVDLTYGSLNFLLPVIFPQSNDLSVRITALSLDDQIVSAVHSFLSRTSVTQLYVQQDFIARCLSAVPNVRALVIDLKEQPEDTCLSEFSYIDPSSNTRIPRCPNLRALHLHSGSVPIEAMREAIEAHPSIQKLRFSACYIEPFEDELLYWLKPHVDDIHFDLRLDEVAVSDWSHTMI